MLYNLQYGRAVAALSVLIFHTWVYFADPQYWGVDIGSGWIDPAGKAGVCFFFALSGFIIYHAHNKDIGKPNQIIKYLFRRFYRVYPLYWVVVGTVFASGFFIPLKQLPYDNPTFVLEIITLLPFNNGHGSILVAWTLFHEIAFYLVFGLLILFGRAGMIILIVWFVANLGGSIMGYDSAFISHFNLIFLFGIGAAIAAPKIRNPYPVAILGLVLFAATYISARESRDHTAVQYLLFGLGSAILISAMAALEMRRNQRQPLRVFAFLGEASYAIYLVHVPVISLASKLMKKFPTGFSALGDFIIVIALSTLVSIGAFILIERPLLSLRRRPCAAPAALSTNPSP